MFWAIDRNSSHIKSKFTYKAYIKTTLVDQAKCNNLNQNTINNPWLYELSINKSFKYGIKKNQNIIIDL